MASLSVATARFEFLKPASWSNQENGVKFVSIGTSKHRFPSLRTMAKPETVDKVVQIVKKQLALSDDVAVTPESKFSAFGADSLDTVEIVMCIEEEFGISVEEDNSQNITTVQEAAELIEKLVQQKAEAA